MFLQNRTINKNEFINEQLEKKQFITQRLKEVSAVILMKQCVFSALLSLGVSSKGR